MTPEEFVKCFYDEKNEFLKTYLDKDSEAKVAQLISSLNLDAERSKIQQEIVDTILTDVMYTILLGLDGSCSIGGHQELYNLTDENENKISQSLEGFAYQYFHSKK